MLTINEPMAATAAHLAACAECMATRCVRRNSKRCAARCLRCEPSRSVTISKSFQSGQESYSLYSCSVINGVRRPAPSNVRTQPQPPERDVACNDDVRVSIIGQLPGAAAVGWSERLCENSLIG